MLNIFVTEHKHAWQVSNEEEEKEEASKQASNTISSQSFALPSATHLCISLAQVPKCPSKCFVKCICGCHATACMALLNMSAIITKHDNDNDKNEGQL